MPDYILVHKMHPNIPDQNCKGKSDDEGPKFFIYVEPAMLISNWLNYGETVERAISHWVDGMKTLILGMSEKQVERRVISITEVLQEQQLFDFAHSKLGRLAFYDNSDGWEKIVSFYELYLHEEAFTIYRNVRPLLSEDNSYIGLDSKELWEIKNDVSPEPSKVKRLMNKVAILKREKLRLETKLLRISNETEKARINETSIQYDNKKSLVTRYSLSRSLDKLYYKTKAKGLFNRIRFILNKKVILGFNKKLETIKKLLIISSSNYFSESWYLEKYPDVEKSKLTAAEHYLKHGWKEGRNPGPSFDTEMYLKINEDVEKEGMNPLIHYELFGKSENRRWNT